MDDLKYWIWKQDFNGPDRKRWLLSAALILAIAASFERALLASL